MYFWICLNKETYLEKPGFFSAPSVETDLCLNIRIVLLINFIRKIKNLNLFFKSSHLTKVKKLMVKELNCYFSKKLKKQPK